MIITDAIEYARLCLACVRHSINAVLRKVISDRAKKVLSKMLCPISIRCVCCVEVGVGAFREKTAVSDRLLSHPLRHRRREELRWYGKNGAVISSSESLAWTE